MCRYTFERICKENGQSLGDESRIIIFNTKGKNTDEISEELIHFFGYFDNSTDEYVSKLEDEAIIKLHERIVELKKSRELEAGYMKLEELLKSHERKGARVEVKKHILEALEVKGMSSKEIVSMVENENNMDKLNKWFSLSLTVQNQDEFIKNM